MDKEVSEYPEICSSVMGLDQKIRFAGMINERGRLVAGGMKENVKPLENERDDEMIFMELALRIKMRKEFDEQLGPVKFAMAMRERILLISFPINEDTLYVAAEPDADYSTLPKRIQGVLGSGG